MVLVSNADRVVFPEVGRTKGDVVAFYERVAPRLLPHVVGRPLSLRRYPKGLAAAGFFQKNVPPHYPASIERFTVPRNDTDVTTYPLVRDAEHLAYLANQGTIELHVPTSPAAHLDHPDRFVLDLDPPPGGHERVRVAATLIRAKLEALDVASALVATGSKGYHVVCPIRPTVSVDVLVVTMQKLAAILAHEHPAELTTAFRVAMRKERVFIDWLRNRPNATVVAPFSIRARARATIATPLAWSELETTAPDAFSMIDVERLVDRADPLLDLARTPAEPERFVAGVDDAFAKHRLVLEKFDRFRS